MWLNLTHSMCFGVRNQLPCCSESSILSPFMYISPSRILEWMVHWLKYKYKMKFSVFNKGKGSSNLPLPSFTVSLLKHSRPIFSFYSQGFQPSDLWNYKHILLKLTQSSYKVYSQGMQEKRYTNLSLKEIKEVLFVLSLLYTFVWDSVWSLWYLSQTACNVNCIPDMFIQLKNCFLYLLGFVEWTLLADFLFPQ